jgi:hypothetical protein
MAYSYQEYPADGINRNFTVPFDYVKQSEVHVYIDGVETTDFEFPSANVISLDTAPTTGQTVRIGRVSDLEERAVDFVAGAVLSEEDLDTALIQIFNGAQEAVDTANQSLRADLDGRADMQNRQVKGVATPTEADHAVNLGFIQTEYGNVTAVKANEGNITTVAQDIANVNTTAGSIASVNTVSGSISNVNAVAAHIPTLNSNYSDINIVATNIDEVANLSSQIDNINTVAESFKTQETAPTTANVGDRWFQPSTNTLYIYGSDSQWYEAAQYQVLRDYFFNNIASGRSNFSGTDSNGNLVSVPVGANVQVIVDGLNLINGTDFTISGTSGVDTASTIPAGSYVEIRVYTPMLTDEYTWFEARKNETESARDSASSYMTTTLGYKGDAETARDTAYQHMVDAQAHRDNALAYRDQANTYKNSAQTFASNSSASASAAAVSAADAAAYAQQASRSDMENGSEGDAGLSFVGDNDTGFYTAGSGVLGITSNAQWAMKVSRATTEIAGNLNVNGRQLNQSQIASYNNYVSVAGSGNAISTPNTVSVSAGNYLVYVGWARSENNPSGDPDGCYFWLEKDNSEVFAINLQESNDVTYQRSAGFTRLVTFTGSGSLRARVSSQRSNNDTDPGGTAGILTFIVSKVG